MALLLGLNRAIRRRGHLRGTAIAALADSGAQRAAGNASRHAVQPGRLDRRSGFSIDPRALRREPAGVPAGAPTRRDDRRCNRPWTSPSYGVQQPYGPRRGRGTTWSGSCCATCCGRTTPSICAARRRRSSAGWAATWQRVGGRRQIVDPGGQRPCPVHHRRRSGCWWCKAGLAAGAGGGSDLRAAGMAGRGPDTAAAARPGQPHGASPATNR